jgi:flagellar protein FlaG
MRIEANLPLDYDPAPKSVRGGENKPSQPQENSPPAMQGSDLNQAVTELNRFFASYNLQFTLHQSSGRYQVKMVNAATQEVIREWPADTILEISARFKQVLEEELGILLDTQV